MNQVRRLLFPVCCMTALSLGVTCFVKIPARNAVTLANTVEVRQLANVIESLRVGAKDYPEAEPVVAETLAQQAPIFVKYLERMGKLQDIILQRTQHGEDVYELWFANGRAICGVSESPAGKIAGMRVELREHK